MGSFNQQLLDHIWDVIGPQQNRTKCPLHRIENLYQKCVEVIENGVEGDFFEAGVWKGGCSALMGKLCEEEGKGRRTWSLDSFEGMSEPNMEFDLLDGEDKPRAVLDVNNLLRNFDLTDFNVTCFDMMKLKPETVEIVPGWVDDTIDDTAARVDKLSVLRVDIDFYEPTKVILDHLYHKVSKGGYVICDDYGAWQGARKAIDDFRAKHNITSPMQQTFKSDNMRVGTEWYWKVE